MDVVTTVAEGAQRNGHDVGIAFGRRPETPSGIAELVHEGVELFPLAWGRRKPREELRTARALRTLLRSWKPDVLHLHSSVAGAVGTTVAPSSLPTIYSPHSFESALPSSGRIRRRIVRTAEQVIVRRAAVLGAVSPSEAEFGRAIGARDVAVVENGIVELDPGRALERALPAEPVVMAGGRTVPQRRPDACARVLAAVSDIADVRWVGGGGGERGVDGRAALDAAAIPTTGWLSRRDGLRYLEEATVYLHWTAWDGQPLSVLEALSRDAVVVASDTPPNRHVLGGGQVFATEEAAVEAIRRVVLDRDHAESLRRSQRSRRDRWSAAQMVDGWLNVYRRYARPTRRSGAARAGRG